jgi:hypothetical protein
VICVVVPLDTEVAAWLDGEAILHPPASDRATMPSPREILEVLDMLVVSGVDSLILLLHSWEE